MSGGHFDYAQYRIYDIETAIKELIASNEDSSLDEYGYPVGRFYSLETIDEFKKAVEYLKLARIYTQKIDWLVCGDYGEDTFHKRLKEDIADESI